MLRGHISPIFYAHKYYMYTLWSVLIFLKCRLKKYRRVECKNRKRPMTTKKESTLFNVPLSFLFIFLLTRMKIKKNIAIRLFILQHRKWRSR